jgi:hypothetical protein
LKTSLNLKIKRGERKRQKFELKKGERKRQKFEQKKVTTFCRAHRYRKVQKKIA